MAQTNTDLPLADELAAVHTRVAGLMLSREKVTAALVLITSTAAEIFPDTVGAGVTLLDEKGRRVSAAATDPLVERVDALQYALGEGPCLVAWKERVVVRVDDVPGDERWPEWARAAAAIGMGSALSTPLVAGGNVFGALKSYAPRVNAYGARDAHLLSMFAAQAAILLAHMRSAGDATRVSDRLRDAFSSRDAIGIAKGIVMAREATTERGAFMVLADLARREHKSLREVAEQLARSTGRLRR